MILSAELLDTFDRCERRFAFEQKYSPRTIDPIGILYAAVESAMCSDEPEQAAKDETMRLAASREIVLTEINKFHTVRHIGFLAGIIGMALHEVYGVMKPVENSTTEDFVWESGLLSDQNGKLHRIELVSHWDDDRLRACAHSWRVIGELAALQSPITLTAVVVGPNRGGRRHSDWTKGLMHPVNHQLRFAPRNAKKTGFNDSWEKVWREHKSEISTSKWLESMKRDGVLDSLILSREVRYDSKDHRMIAARQEMALLAVAMEGSYEKAPMRRSSCDETGRGACPFQNVCYAPTSVTPAEFPGLYQIRRGKPEEVPA